MDFMSELINTIINNTYIWILILANCYVFCKPQFDYLFKQVNDFEKKQDILYQSILKLKTIIDNYNIEIKYHKKITNLCLLELLLNYLKNIDLSTIQINKNIYSVNINMSNKELYNIIHEYNLNIRNIHSIKKKILIKKINEKLEEIYS